MKETDLLLRWLDQAIADADRTATDRAARNDWQELAFQKRLASWLRKHRDGLLKLGVSGEDVAGPGREEGRGEAAQRP